MYVSGMFLYLVVRSLEVFVRRLKGSMTRRTTTSNVKK